MFIIEFFRSKGNTKKHICVSFSIFFIVFCVFILVCGFIDVGIWGKIYSMPESAHVAVIVVYVFASLMLITCVFLLIAVKQDNNKEILACALMLLALWQVHLIVTFIALILHTLSKQDFQATTALWAAMPLLSIQALWMYFIAITWMYWREMTKHTDVPAYVRMLLLKRKRKKAIRQDQRERLGNLPSRFLQALVPQTRGIASANAL